MPFTFDFFRIFARLLGLAPWRRGRQREMTLQLQFKIVLCIGLNVLSMGAHEVYPNGVFLTKQKVDLILNCKNWTENVKGYLKQITGTRKFGGDVKVYSFLHMLMIDIESVPYDKDQEERMMNWLWQDTGVRYVLNTNRNKLVRITKGNAKINRNCLRNLMWRNLFMNTWC